MIAWGVVLALMNCCFYLAIDRLPLATVAAIEFLPVIVLAALGARSRRNAAALALAVPGVYLLTGVHLEGEPLGVALAFANAGLFAAYIVLAHRVASDPAIAGIDGLAAAMLIALVAVTPMAGWAALPAFTDPVALAAGIGVGISSSVIPYVADQIAMARLTRAAYALMVSLLPGDRDRRRPARAHAGADADRRARDRARHRGGGAPSRAHSSASRTTVAARGGHLLQRRPLPRRVVVVATREQVRRRQAHRAQPRAVGAAADRRAHRLDALGADRALGQLRSPAGTASTKRRMFGYCGVTSTSSRAPGARATTSSAVRRSSAVCAASLSSSKSRTIARTTACPPDASTS